MERLVKVAPFVISLWMIIDVNYFMRTLWCIIISRLTRRKTPPGLFAPVMTWGICLPMDLDFNLHMNNGRYLRECDFARFQFWFQSHLFVALRKLGCNVTNRCNNIRYRKSILPFQRFKIQTKIVFWDERSFYLEQQMIRCSDNFICAVNYTCQPILFRDRKITPQQVIESIYGQVDTPEAPPEIAAWIKSTELSSRAMYTNTEI